MSVHSAGPRPTLEDLLRFKRAEQPSPEFWAQFDRELREKQLAAMVEKRPWWCAFPRTYVLIVRHRLPLAAAAAFAAGVGVLAVGTPFFKPQGAASGLQVAASPVARQAVFRATAVVRRVSSTAVAARSKPPVHAEVAQAPAAAALPSIPLVEDVTPAEVSARFDPGSAQQPGGLQLTPIPASALFLRSMAELQRGSASRLTPASAQVVEPLARMTSPAAIQRSRLLGEAVPASWTRSVEQSRLIAEAAPVSWGRSDDATVAQSGDRQVSRLSNDSLYSPTAPRRYDVAADRALMLSNSIRFSIKF